MCTASQELTSRKPKEVWQVSEEKRENPIEQRAKPEQTSHNIKNSNKCIKFGYLLVTREMKM
jgi:hypothetical protein